MNPCIFNDLDYHSVCPDGRLGASRTPTAGKGTWPYQGPEGYLGDELLFTYQQGGVPALPKPRFTGGRQRGEASRRYRLRGGL